MRIVQPREAMFIAIAIVAAMVALAWLWRRSSDLRGHEADLLWKQAREGMVQEGRDEDRTG